MNRKMMPVRLKVMFKPTVEYTFLKSYLSRGYEMACQYYSNVSELNRIQYPGENFLHLFSGKTLENAISCLPKIVRFGMQNQLAGFIQKVKIKIRLLC